MKIVLAERIGRAEERMYAFRSLMPEYQKALRQAGSVNACRAKRGLTGSGLVWVAMPSGMGDATPEVYIHGPLAEAAITKPCRSLKSIPGAWRRFSL